MSNRKRVYLAGPIRRGDLAANVNAATIASLHLAACGFAPMTPQWSVYSASAAVNRRDGRVDCVGDYEGMMGHEDWMGVDLAWVAVADLLLRLPGASDGADREVAEAERLGIPVFYDVKAICGEPKFSLRLFSEDRPEREFVEHAYRYEDAEFLRRFYEASLGGGVHSLLQSLEVNGEVAQRHPSPTTVVV